MKQLNQNYKKEKKMLNENWERVNAETIMKFEAIEKEILERQKQEHEELSNTLEKIVPEKSKPSAKFLNIKKIQREFAKQKK